MTVAPSPPLAAPFRGLAPFGEGELDALLFFGRERETEIAVANLLASRLTVLYGPSGVGKTSLLRAGVARRVRELAERRAIGRGPDAAVVVFADWSGEPVAALADAIAREVGSLTRGSAAPPPAGASLADVVEHWSTVLDGEVFLVLDQLEEYFVYHGGAAGGDLVEELPEVVGRPRLRGHVLLSLRDDALAQLDVLKDRLPSLYANVLRLDRLDRAAATAAVVGPVRRFSELVPAAARIEVEPELVAAVVAQSAVREGETRVEAPYLQLVMERLWDEELARGSHLLRASTLRELGGAREIVRDHLERALTVLDEREQDAAARMFEHLVTPSGTKIAHRAPDLAEFAELDAAEAASVLSALGRERIVRRLDDEQGGERFEIFHDVLAGAILEWRGRHEVEHERVVARRRHRRLVVALVAAIALLGVMTGIAVYALDQRSHAREQAALARQQSELARRQSKIAVQQTRVARDEAQRATAAQRRAQAAERRALEQRRRADLAAQRARVAQQAAVAAAGAERRQRQIADDEARVAQAQRQAAVAQKARADRARARADRLAVEAREGRVAAVAAAASARRAERAAEAAADRSRANANAFEALAQLDRDPERSLRLALAAYALDPKLPVVERALRLSLLAAKTRRILPGGGGAVAAAAYDPQGRFVATGSARGSARIFDAASGRLVRVLAAGGDVRAVAWSPDGTRLATGGADGRAVVWDAATGAALRVFRSRGAVVTVAFAPDGRRLLVAATDPSLAVVDVDSGLELQRISLPGVPRLAAFSPTADRILTVVGVTVAGRPARVYDAATGALVQSFTQRGQITTAAFSPDGGLVATGGRDDLAAVWDARTGALVHTLAGHRGDVVAVAFSPDGSELATTSTDVTARVWSMSTFETKLILVGHTTATVSASFSHDGTKLVTAGTDRTARVWSTSDGAPLAVLRGDTESVTAASFAPGDGAVVTASADGTARIWDTTDEPRMAVLGRHDGRAFGAAWSGDGARLVSAGADGTLRVWDVRRRRELARLAAGTPLDDAAITHDGRFVAAAAADGSLRVWPVAGGGATVLRAGTAALRSVAFSPDGLLLVAGGDDGSATVWRWRTRTVVATLRHPAAVLDAVFSPGGDLVATGCADGLARLWSPAGARLVRAFAGHGDAVTGVAFDTTGRLLATSSRDKDARVWSVASGATLRTLRGHSAVVSGVSFSGDGAWIATAGPIKVGIWATQGDDLPADRLSFLVGPTAQVSSVAFSPRGFTVAATSYDGTVRTFDCRLCGGVAELVPLARAHVRAVGR